MGLSQSQQRLVEETIPMVEILARRIFQRFPDVPLDDFRSAGHLAAVEAARSFDPSRGVPFEAFAYRHVAGMMRRNATVENFGIEHVLIRRALAADPEVPPSDLPLEEVLEDSQEKAKQRALGWARRQAAGIFIADLSQRLRGTDGGEEALIERQEYAAGHEALRRAVEALDAQERVVVQRHYSEGATFQEIASELGVVDRTVKRIHQRLKDKLAEQLRGGGITHSIAPVDL